MKKWLPYLLLAIMAIAIILLRKTGSKNHTDLNKPPVTGKDSQVNRNRGFDRRTSFLQYSNHAKCRMKCRQITPPEVEEIMKEGRVNYKKSDIKNARCPRYAIEGITSDKQRVRIVFAQCNESTVVVTAIDLETEYPCHCPGDDDKQDNK
jgi:hypothetical protein